MKKIPFCVPWIDENVVAEVNDALTRTGWITTGPKTKAFEAALASYCKISHVLAVNSWFGGATLMMKWWGIQPGDEVIVPAYTYSATALAAMNLGAKVVMVDVDDNFNIDPSEIKKAITARTKLIIPVDMGGRPCDYNSIHQIVDYPSVKMIFKAANEKQASLGRILVMADAAHAIGAEYRGKMAGALTDVSVFSFHSVKNITTGEGGAVALNLPEVFDRDEVMKELRALHLYGQTKSAHDKYSGENSKAQWAYDIVSEGIKANMNDVCAAIGLAQLKQYPDKLLPQRRSIYEKYNEAFANEDWAICPELKGDDFISSAHLYLLRIRGFGVKERNALIDKLSSEGIATNVHYIPLPDFSFFISRGYNAADYPNSYSLYENEISLPLYNGLTTEQQDYIISKLKAVIGELN